MEMSSTSSASNKKEMFRLISPFMKSGFAADNSSSKFGGAGDFISSGKEDILRRSLHDDHRAPNAKPGECA